MARISTRTPNVVQLQALTGRHRAMIRQYAFGESVSEIASGFSIHRSTVSRVVHSALGRAHLARLQKALDDECIHLAGIAYIQQVYAYYSALIAPSATAERAGYTFLNSSADFYQAISELNAHVSLRAVAADAYLNP
jgi:DNA-binding CsgD family transcriptional regulator